LPKNATLNGEMLTNGVATGRSKTTCPQANTIPWSRRSNRFLYATVSRTSGLFGPNARWRAT
jgi:hypothetical protein